MNIVAIAVKRKKSFAGVAPVVFKSAKRALRRISGGSVTDRLGSVRIVNEYV